jgi:hypothetical protein
LAFDKTKIEEAPSMRKWLNSNNKQFYSVVLTIALGGFIAVPSASADTIKVSLVEYGKSSKPNITADDFEIGSTLVMKVKKVVSDKSQLGSYSREDGSRAGAYGDGEYAD